MASMLRFGMVAVQPGRMTPGAFSSAAPGPTARPHRRATSMSTILVTGASGFVGRHLVPALLAAGHTVVALVRTPTAGEMVVGALPAGRRKDVETRIGDVTRPATLVPVMAGIDAVVHLV